MLKRLIWVLVGEFAFFGLPTQAQMNVPQIQDLPSEKIDISARAEPGNRLPSCRVTGQVVLWISRPVAVLNDMRENAGAIEAGLAQFNAGSRLEGCVPDGRALDLSDRFANVMVADERAFNGEIFGREEAGVLASQLAQNLYHLAEDQGTPIPLVEGFQMRAIGSVSYQFTIVLIRNAKFHSYDAVVHRVTLGTKFARRLTGGDRSLSRVKWNSIQSGALSAW